MSFNQNKVTFIDINHEESKDFDKINNKYDMINSIRINFKRNKAKTIAKRKLK